MIFTFFAWDKFCKSLAEKNIHSVTAKSLLSDALNSSLTQNRWLNLKHDVESKPEKALRLAQIEARYGHRSTYYVQSYLMTDDNQQLFISIQELGHEVTYHHDVIDGSKGDLGGAVKIFVDNLNKFKRFGFEIVTVCQHGNPMSTYENRDFFRSEKVRALFPFLVDIMVNFGDKIGQKYVYVSDVGMSFKIVNDPVNSDKKKDNEKYIVLGTLDRVVEEIVSHPTINYMVSSHPHRYYQSYIRAWLKTALFTIVRSCARLLFNVPGLKNFVFKFSFISKKL